MVFVKQNLILSFILMEYFSKKEKTEIDLIDYFKEKAKKDPQKIVFPEGNDERILYAVAEIVGQGFAKPILLGNIEEIQEKASKLNIDLNEVGICDPCSSSNLDDYASTYNRKRKGVSHP